MRTDVVITPSPALPWGAEMLCFTMLCEHDALKHDNQSPAKLMPLSSETPTLMRTDVVITPSPALPWGAEMLCFTILCEHDALKDDSQSPAKLMPLSSETPTSDAS